MKVIDLNEQRKKKGEDGTTPRELLEAVLKDVDDLKEVVIIASFKEKEEMEIAYSKIEYVNTIGKLSLLKQYLIDKLRAIE